MHYQLQSYFANGGGPCYIVSVGKPKQLLSKKELKKGLDEVYKYAEPTLLVFPDAIHLAKASDLYALYNEALLQASELGDRFVIMDISHNELQGKFSYRIIQGQRNRWRKSSIIKIWCCLPSIFAFSDSLQLCRQHGKNNTRYYH